MPSRLRKRKSRSTLPPPQNSTREMPRSPVLSPGITTSLDSVQITPRTPRTARPKYAEADDSLVGRDVEEVEMSLLSVDERSRAEPGFANGYLEDKQKAPIISLEDKRAMVLLCVLCAFLLSSSSPMVQMTKQLRFTPLFLDLIQGVPVRQVVFSVAMMTCPDPVTRT